MENILAPAAKARISTPVIALALYAVASGYLMSLIPLMLPYYGLDSSLASWLASVFYVGLLLGAIIIEPIVSRLGHKYTLALCLAVFAITSLVLPVLAHSSVWLVARLVAGFSVAGIFVVVESWLLQGSPEARAKRLGLYMAALYGGSAIGQLGISYVDVGGYLPFLIIGILVCSSIAVVLFGRCDQPQSEYSANLTAKQIFKLNHAALIGSIVSGLVIGAIYGMMPLELAEQGIENSDIGSLMALIILGGMLVQPVVPWMSKYLGRTLLMAFFCLLGTLAVSLVMFDDDLRLMALGLFLLGMAAFALYPIAINLGCDNLDAKYIVSATQVMLFSYSIGSVLGPVIADQYMSQEHTLLGYLFSILLATCLYMLAASLKFKNHVVAGE
ncbi:MFS transporter [Vibrio sp. OCN044]|uniref:MFS transporter n=1 Tax=Vibrio tetraodonis subsp. pristinus TaxID=2695891 RepID=A0A6L8LY28_9VIBR|nr:MFS transporter [Vibrio tetraodonis]MYM60403.1 MFS transporter [Vibrio tetraodonis subsp. pristinus]